MKKDTTSLRIAVFETISQTRAWADAIRASGKTIGFVPTMGALHPGHISLVEKARSECDFVITSIFVNPTQFNNSSDLERYPRTMEADLEMLQKHGCNAVFTPEIAEMYPTLQKGHWEFGLVSSRLEGFYRPGHFDGVCTVVKKLFEIATPHKAYFGEKDFQQLAIIRKLTAFEKMDIEIVSVSTMRETDGLAMSSRNLRLSAEQRTWALGISKTLFAMREKRKTGLSPVGIEKFGQEMIANQQGITLEYLEIVDTETFDDIKEWDNRSAVVLFAGYVGEIRLIDNITL
ncbi:MAG: pantoate--beta-alanine ligase [Flavobacteriales bacterium]